jgi:UDP-N-acetylglucosamine 2-epimerase (non-hydrolysing)
VLTLTVIFGTRPEIVKLAPVIHAAKRRGHRIKAVLTGQHRDMAVPLLKFFKIAPDLDLDVMMPNQTLGALSERILEAMNVNQERLKADCLIVQGDTTSAFMASYWAFCQKIPVAHVEAGLRTYDLGAPYPEEGNRQLIGRLADFHFAPTLQATKALENEQVHKERIFTVGNTAIDALQYALEEISALSLTQIPDLTPELVRFVGGHSLILVTAHRRESFGEGFDGICEGIKKIADSREDIRLVYPVHPNPNVRSPVEKHLESHPRILLCDPIPYVGFVALMKRASVLLTDSGGIQEEGPTLRKPIIVMREKTERPEGVTAGFSKLVGTDPGLIVHTTLTALDKGLQTNLENPYGDGKSALRIIETLEKRAACIGSQDP